MRSVWRRVWYPQIAKPTLNPYSDPVVLRSKVFRWRVLDSSGNVVESGFGTPAMWVTWFEWCGTVGVLQAGFVRRPGGWLTVIERRRIDV